MLRSVAGAALRHSAVVGSIIERVSNTLSLPSPIPRLDPSVNGR
jgi:hypothetical protein